MKHTAVLDEITANTDALHGKMLLLLREQLAKAQVIIKPTPNPLLTEKLKSSLSKKLTLAGAIDARQTKLMLLPESSMVTSRESEGDVEDPGESENDAVQEENVASPKRELLRQLTLQDTILMDCSDSVDREFIMDVIKRFRNNLMSLIDISSIKDQEQILKFKKTFSSMFPIHELGSIVQGMKLKIKDISLPQFSGKESEYFRFKADALDLLNNSRHDNSSHTRALKSHCFKQCPNVLDLVRHCKTVSEIFEISLATLTDIA